MVSSRACFVAGTTPSHLAAGNGHLEVLRLLLEHGADKDQTNCNGLTLLRLAALNGHLEVVRLLVDLGAEIDKASTAGATPLHLAALNGHAEVVQLLLQAWGVTNTNFIRLFHPQESGTYRLATHKISTKSPNVADLLTGGSHQGEAHLSRCHSSPPGFSQRTPPGGAHPAGGALPRQRVHARWQGAAARCGVEWAQRDC